MSCQPRCPQSERMAHPWRRSVSARPTLMLDDAEATSTNATWASPYALRTPLGGRLLESGPGARRMGPSPRGRGRRPVPHLAADVPWSGRPPTCLVTDRIHPVSFHAVLIPAVSLLVLVLPGAVL